MPPVCERLHIGPHEFWQMSFRDLSDLLAHFQEQQARADEASMFESMKRDAHAQMRGLR